MKSRLQFSGSQCEVNAKLGTCSRGLCIINNFSLFLEYEVIACLGNQQPKPYLVLLNSETMVAATLK